MQKISAILFDKDGTLLNFNETWLSAYQIAAKFLADKFNADADKLLAAGGFIAATQTWSADSSLAIASNADNLNLWQKELGVEFDEECKSSLLEIFKHAREDCTAVVELQPLLKDLRARGLVLGMATMDDAENAYATLQHFNITDYFDFVCGADSGFGLKPETGMVNAFCKQCNLVVAQIAMVGDSIADLQMGTAAGVGLRIGVLSGAGDAEILKPHADIILNDISELPAALF